MDLKFDPLEKSYVSNPYEFFADLRKDQPLFNSGYKTWILSRYSDIIAALGSPHLNTEPSNFAVIGRRNIERFTCASVASNIIPYLSGLEHRIPRKIFSRHFIKAQAKLDETITTIADELVDECMGLSEFDAVEKLARPYSIRVISKLIGIPEKDYPIVDQLSPWFFYIFAYIPTKELLHEVNHNLDLFRRYFQELLQTKREQPGDDMISKLAMESELPDEQIVDNLMLFYSDGVENVDSGIANGIYSILQHPDQHDSLRSNIGLTTTAVDECLRFESPGQFVGRQVTWDHNLLGHEVKKGDVILLMVGSGNRDEQIFEHADQFNIRRSPNPQIAFGQGTHNCVGRILVEKEMKILFESLFQRKEQLELLDPLPDWDARIGHRWMRSLHLGVKH